MFNPFRRRVRIPIRKMPGGWEPWNNRQPPKAMSWRPFIMAGVGVFAGCGLIYGLWMTFLAPSVIQPTPTLDLMNPDTFVEEIIYFDRTPGFGSGGSTDTPTPTITPTATVELTATPQPITPTATTGEVTFGGSPYPTYTAYPTYTPQPVVVEYNELIMTSPPEIIYQPGEVVYNEIIITMPVEIIQTVVVVEYQIITATPSPTPIPPPVFTQPPPIYLLPPTEATNATTP